ncbi:MAG: hypothetical protein IT578_08740 [Verrucomicrobiae bacterium]|nr:hypothetical protein [Verrucomicrobiae bacterium]
MKAWFAAVFLAACVPGWSAGDALARKSAAIWEEAARKKLAEETSNEGGGDLQIGESTLHLTSLKLRLGPLKTPGDLHGGQEMSELVGRGKGGSRIAIGSVSITAATTPEHVAGQTFEIARTNTTEIVMPDGAKWRFQDGGVTFLQTGVSNVHLLIEGRAVPLNRPKAAPVRVSGEVRAGVELLPARASSSP